MSTERYLLYGNNKIVFLCTQKKIVQCNKTHPVCVFEV